MMLGVAVGDLLQAERNRAQAAAAQLVDAEGGLFLRNAGFHRRLAGRVLALRGGQDLPEDDLVDFARVDLRRSSALLMATAPSSCAGILPKAPLNEPTGVLFALAMTISEAGMVYLPFEQE